MWHFHIMDAMAVVVVSENVFRVIAIIVVVGVVAVVTVVLVVSII